MPTEKPTQVNIEFDKTRSEFRKLILVNPNHFGNLKDSAFKLVQQIVGNTSYESIGSVGFQPQFNRLNAVIYIHQSSGYNGDICSNGSSEYVRFYVSKDGDTWDDLGLASFSAYNISLEKAQAKRLEYAVSLNYAPQRIWCSQRNLLQVRAILSWNVPPPPNTPDFKPVWGDAHDTNIQVEPSPSFNFGDLLTLGVSLPKEILHLINFETPVPVAPPKLLNALALQAAYSKADVEPHRFALPELTQLIAQPLLSQSLMIVKSPSILPELQLHPEVLAKALDNLVSVKESDTRYEALEAIGLNPNQDTLEGVIRLKLSNGYSGGTCTSGSREYVTFWADFDNNGSFDTCLGATSVNVYDIDDIPKAGLEYAVFLPVNLSAYRQPCDKWPRTVPIRAIMSWQVLPPCNDPNYIPVWGNRLETVIHIKPGRTNPLNTHTPNIETVGSMAINDINQVSGLANGPAQLAGFSATDSPFGREVIITGHLAYPSDISNGAAALRYRVRVRKVGDVNWQSLNNPFEIDRSQLLNGVWSNLTNLSQIVDTEGYYTYQEDLTTGINNAQITVAGNVLARWQTAGLDGLYEIMIDAKSAAGIVWPGNVVRVKLDNTAPAVPPGSFKITSGGGNCADFETGVVIEGEYAVSDVHFGTLNISVQPNQGGTFIAPALLPRSYPAVSTFGETGIWRLDTTGMPRCGYVVALHVWDRTIVNSGTVGLQNSAVVGLCLRSD